MKVVSINLSPPVGPAWAPTTCTLSHGIAPGLTKFASREDAITLPQTVLVSRESSQVTRTMPPSTGLGLKKWVVTCRSWSLNNVACGVNNVQATPGPDGRQTHFCV